MATLIFVLVVLEAVLLFWEGIHLVRLHRNIFALWQEQRAYEAEMDERWHNLRSEIEQAPRG